MRILLWLSLASITVALCGLVWFAGLIARVEPRGVIRADAIVVLTGGAQRVEEATRLMAKGQAKRLFITGVHPATSRADIARRFADIAIFMDCCVDLDYEAGNTVENAEQTRLWVEKYRFRSLIVVTSAYHMPRTLLEFEVAMPAIQMTPHPVISDAVRLDAWWADASTLRILLGEYAKYVMTWSRQFVLRRQAALTGHSDLINFALSANQMTS